MPEDDIPQEAVADEEIGVVGSNIEEAAMLETIKHVEGDKHVLATGWEIFCWTMYDWANSVVPNTVTNVFLPLLVVRMATDSKVVADLGIQPSVIPFLNVAVSVSLELVLFITVGPMGDFGSNRMRLLVLFALVGCIGCLSVFFMVSPELWWVASLLYIIINTSFGTSVVFYNAFLPLLVENHPKLVEARHKFIQQQMVEKPEQSCCEGEEANSSDMGKDEVKDEDENRVEDTVATIIAPIKGLDEGLTAEHEDKKKENVDMEENSPSVADGDDESNPTMELEVELELEEAQEQDGEEEKAVVVEAPLTLRDLFHVSRSIDDKVSSYGYIMGYIGALVMLVVNVGIIVGVLLMLLFIFPLLGLSEQSGSFTLSVQERDLLYVEPFYNFAIRLNIVAAGLWWLIFSNFTFFGLKKRAGKELTPKYRYFYVGLEQMLHTMTLIKRIPFSFVFLFAYFVYSDGYATVIIAATLVVNAYYPDVSDLELALLVIIVMISAGLGVYFFYGISRLPKMNAKHIVLINLFFLQFLTLGGLVILPSKFLLYPVAFIYGFNIGSVQSFSRSLFARLIPPGYETDFFSLFEITDKGTAWLGPLTLVVTITLTGSIGIGMLSLLPFFWVGMLVLCFVLPDKGYAMAQKCADTERMAASVGVTIPENYDNVSDHHLDNDNDNGNPVCALTTD